jgi:integrase
MKKPWFRKQTGCWYVEIGERQINLGKDKDEAQRQYHRIMAEEGLIELQPVKVRAAHLCDLFLEWASRHTTARTYQWYKMYLQDFCNRYGTLYVSQVKPFHITKWLDAHEWLDSGRRGAVTSIKRALNWGVDEGLIPTNPVARVRRPPVTRRERILSSDEIQSLLDACSDEAFRDFLFVLRETGCRPGEVASLTAQMVDLKLGIWTFVKHKTARKTGKPRVVYLPPSMIALSQRLMVKYPTGLLFRDSRGMAWNKNSVVCRFRRLREKLKLDGSVVAYSFRHTFITEGLARGVPIADMAELVGHTSTDMICRVYSHLDQKVKHLRAAACRATGQIDQAECA